MLIKVMHSWKIHVTTVTLSSMSISNYASFMEALVLNVCQFGDTLQQLLYKIYSLLHSNNIAYANNI